MLVFDGIRALIAGKNILNVVNLSSFGASFSSMLVENGPNTVSFLDAVDEVDSLLLIFNEVDATRLNEVIVTLLSSMLASELPTLGGLLLFSVSVWVEIDFSHIEETFGSVCFSKWAGDQLLASRALTFVEEFNLDFVLARH